MNEQIVLNENQKEHFSELYTAAIRDITTEPAFTSELKRELIENMPTTTSIEFYQVLRANYQDAAMLRRYIENNPPEKKTTTVKKSKGKKQNW